ncbi:membrane protein DedA with SNARE-associated domain [Arcanobacterium pluranimalium]|uniref:DedA family protein n=1 Tax=Arcanobacterium pluranimalium TaxID=108028 RepID=UPI001EF7F5D3|nr:DedA family protein [Arcanobacterium pluranimalium]MBM7824355.1 membrane protein DedA with SNARE-associated domain [Arcanobacterium pluranimalium]
MYPAFLNAFMQINPVLTNPVLTQSSTSTQDLSGIAAWTVTIMESLGGVGIALLIAAENLFPPIPSEVILPLAGFTASQGTQFGILAAIIWATVGSVIGAILLYGAARWIGRERTRAIMGKLPLFDTADIDKTEAFFHKHDRSTVFFGRMLPIFRSLISLPAGVVKMNLPLFLLFTTVGSAIWNTALIYAGYALGENWNLVEDYIGILTKIVAGIVVVAIIVWIVLKVRRNKAKKNSLNENTDDDSLSRVS